MLFQYHCSLSNLQPLFLSALMLFLAPPPLPSPISPPQTLAHQPSIKEFPPANLHSHQSGTTPPVFLLQWISSEQRRRMSPPRVLSECDLVFFFFLHLYGRPISTPLPPPTPHPPPPPLLLSYLAAGTEGSAMSFCVASAQTPSRLCQRWKVTGRKGRGLFLWDGGYGNETASERRGNTRPKSRARVEVSVAQHERH